MKKIFRVLALLITPLMHGCATPLIEKNMIPYIPPSFNHFNASLIVDDVKGGAEMFAERYKTLTSVDMYGPVFKSAIIGTLTKSKMFLPVAVGESGKYILQPEIVFQETSVDRVGSGSFTYTLNAKYTILEKKTNQIVYTNQFTSACVKTMEDSFGWPPRYRMAIECAVQDNLANFIFDLSSNLKV